MHPKNKGNRLILSFFNRFYIGVVALSLFWGCAAKSDTVLIKGTSTAIEADTIISSYYVKFSSLRRAVKIEGFIFVAEEDRHHVWLIAIHESYPAYLRLLDYVLDISDAGDFSLFSPHCLRLPSYLVRAVDAAGDSAGRGHRRICQVDL